MKTPFIPIPNIKHLAESKSAGVELVGNGKNRAHKKYLIKACGHEQEISIGNVRKQAFQCNTCLWDSIKSDALKSGMVLISDGSADSKKCHVFKFISCGHEQNFRVDTVRAGVNCTVCRETEQWKSYQRHAKNAGLNIIGAGSSSRYLSYEFIKCGHQQQFQKVAVSREEFTCQQCEDTCRTLPSCAYLLRITSDGFTWLKFGYTKSVNLRISQYKLPADSQVEILAVVDFDTGNAAHTFESTIHKLHERHKLDGELMSQYHKSGQTECYPVWMNATLETTIHYEASKD